MKITLICPVFPPEPAPSGVMTSQLGSRLGEDGHRVNLVVSFPSRPRGRLYEGYKRCLGRVEKQGRMQVIRSPSWLIGARRRYWSRVLENVTFGISSTFNAWRAGRPDVLIVETWPLFAVQLGMWLGRWWRVPVLYYVQDVYPEVMEDAGILRPGGIWSRWLRAWDRSLCLQSYKVVVISDSMRDLLRQNRRLPTERIAVIPNWVDPKELVPQDRNNAWRREMDIDPRLFVAMFAGTMGTVSGADVLIEVAKQLHQRPDILILCVGEGVLKDSMIAEARRAKLTNIRFEPFQPRERLSEVQASADAMLLTVRKDFRDGSVPSKLISYMAAGRPIVCAAPQRSGVVKSVEAAQAGIPIPPADSTAISRAIEHLAGRPDEAQRMGRNARDYFEKNLTLDRAYGKFTELFHEAVRPWKKPEPHQLTVEVERHRY